jgi:DNA-binding IclR family transcriptional regulator
VLAIESIFCDDCDMAPKELLAVRLLMDNPQGLFGSELVHLSKGRLGRGTVYMLLERLVNKGWVSKQDEMPSVALNLRRTRHFVTEQGSRACLDFATAHGLSLVRGTFAPGLAQVCE